MFEFTAAITIHTTIRDLWNYLINVEAWWLASNPEHIGLEILSDDQPIQVGTQLLIREKVAGIPGEIQGEIQELTVNEKISWQSTHARYNFLGIPLSVKEGVTWQVEESKSGVKLSAHVWAEFPRTLIGRSLEWIFKNVLNGVHRDHEHAMTELRYIKAQMEN